MSLIRKPIFWIGVVGVGIAGWVATSPESQTSSGITTTKRAAKKSQVKKGGSAFVAEDYDAKFETVNIELKNSFQPIVARRSGGFGAGDGMANAIPPEFAAGDSGWFFTGNAEIDNVPTALFENRSTGEGVFLKAGDRWKSCMIAQILPDSVVMKGPSGTKTFSLVNEERPPALAGGFAPLPVAVSPEMRNQNRGGTAGGSNFGRGQGANFGGNGGAQFGVLPGAGAGVVTIPSGDVEVSFTPGE